MFAIQMGCFGALTFVDYLATVRALELWNINAAASMVSEQAVMRSNKAFQAGQNMLSCLWFAQKSRQHILAAKERRWMSASEQGDRLLRAG